MFDIIAVSILGILAAVIALNYYFCKVFYRAWLKQEKANWISWGKPSFQAFYEAQLDDFYPIIFGNECVKLKNKALMKASSDIKFTWYAALILVVTGCGLVGFEANLTSGWAIV
ncbi:hypothetical protein N473_21395 [Pseudoalteromonas luteoviolacea CPMOR-1]|uniref:Uncharacterized protein n=2 Tax=Pseudoalteromonas luteoviolacea TaxID=43657 RepID=A0A161YL22_9GAMM|nr:hypothetical protein [Pseudoalteromonas luteoviolacea]KZN62103.1 hypothetical protein N473_21395 [Pseudoalteromonas luteoviolacea CPMOR-1]